MYHTLGGLQVLGEIGARKKPADRWGGIHHEIRGLIQFDNNATHLVGVVLVVLQPDVLDMRKGIFDLVTSLFVVNVVCHGTLIG